MTSPNKYRNLNEAIQAWKQSGLTQIQFCKENNYPYSRLKNHKRDLTRKPQSKNTFTRVVKQKSYPQPTSLKLTFPQGAVLDFSISQLKEVLQAIQGASL
jgi:hypothetical protein